MDVSIWDDAKKNLTEWYSVTADRTTEITRVTSRRYDKWGLSRDIERQFSELGSVVYNGLREGDGEVLEKPVVRDLMERIAELEQLLRAKDEEIAGIRREAEERKAASAAGPKPEGEDGHGESEPMPESKPSEPEEVVGDGPDADEATGSADPEDSEETRVEDRDSAKKPESDTNGDISAQ